MDVRSYFPKDEEVPKYSTEVWLELLQMRMKTFQGFAALEEKAGLVQAKVSFSSPRGQDILRLMMFRVLEEFAESHLSQDPTHFKEEAIDALNYLLSAIMLDQTLFPMEDLCQRMNRLTIKADDLSWGIMASRAVTALNLAELVIQICGHLPDTFRNRAWMENSQNAYFEGVDEVYSTLSSAMVHVFKSFDNWPEFYKYYVAKDRVLQFRLASKY